MEPKQNKPKEKKNNLHFNQLAWIHWQKEKFKTPRDKYTLLQKEQNDRRFVVGNKGNWKPGDSGMKSLKHWKKSSPRMTEPVKLCLKNESKIITFSHLIKSYDNL